MTNQQEPATAYIGRHRSRLLGWCFVALVLLVGVGAACSEPAPEESAGDGGDTSTAEDANDSADGDAAANEEVSEPGDGDSGGDTENSDDDGDSEDRAGENLDDDGDTDDTDDTVPIDDDSVIGEFAGQSWFRGTVPEGAVAADPDAEPVKIGMINIEESVAGSFPEVRAAGAAAVEFINAELGGVDGRPIEFIPCKTDFSVEASQACAQQMVQEEVLAVLGGIDITSDGSIPVLEQNNLPLIGGIPVGAVEMTSDIAFYFSGGGSGMFAALTYHAITENDAETIAIAYGDFGSFIDAARDFGGGVAESQGATAELIPFPITTADFLPVFTKAQEVGADAIVLGAGDTSCLPAMQVRSDLGITVPLYLSGACAADEILAQADGLLDDVYFNTEGPIDPDVIEGLMYQNAVDAYATEPAGGAGTVGFRGMMNLWDVLVTVGGDNLTSEAVLETIRASDDHPSFWGFNYTCATEQIPGLQALCGPDQAVFQILETDGELEIVGAGPERIDVPSLVNG